MGEKEALQLKVVLVGESGVGKTSIINRYTSDTFRILLAKKDIELWQKYFIKMLKYVFQFMISVEKNLLMN